MSGKAIRKGKNRRKVRRDFGPYTIQSSTSKDARSNNFPTHPSCHSFSSWWRERERERPPLVAILNCKYPPSPIEEELLEPAGR